jgi:outer membrane immunogenic protein
MGVRVLKKSVCLLASVAAVALLTTAARADGYWPQSTARTQGPLPWTGPYVGLNLGYAWHDVAGIYDNAGNPTDLSGTEPNGPLVGGQIGYNLRMNWFLMGVELDADTAIDSSSVIDRANGAQLKGNLSYLASARGRLGVLWNNVLLYGTAGVGAARYTFTEMNGGFIGEQRLKDTAAVYGGGLEWMVAYGVSLRTEYLRYDMSDSASLAPAFPGVDPGDFVRFRDVDIVRAGVNVRLAP